MENKTVQGLTVFLCKNRSSAVVQFAERSLPSSDTRGPEFESHRVPVSQIIAYIFARKLK